MARCRRCVHGPIGSRRRTRQRLRPRPRPPPALCARRPLRGAGRRAGVRSRRMASRQAERRVGAAGPAGSPGASPDPTATATATSLLPHPLRANLNPFKTCRLCPGLAGGGCRVASARSGGSAPSESNADWSDDLRARVTTATWNSESDSEGGRSGPAARGRALRATRPTGRQRRQARKTRMMEDPSPGGGGRPDAPPADDEGPRDPDWPGPDSDWPGPDSDSEGRALRVRTGMGRLPRRAEGGAGVDGGAGPTRRAVPWSAGMAGPSRCFRSPRPARAAATRGADCA